MNITKENIDDLNAILRIKLEKEDYEEKVNDTLSDFRKKARIDGFRPGKVPFGLISKMYRKPVLVEQVNKILSESIAKYLSEQNINILGEPLPNEQEQEQIDWDNQTEFNFSFDLGLAPDPEVNVSPKDDAILYRINIDDQIRSKYIDNYTSHFGSLKPVEIIDEKSVIKADLIQLDNDGNPVEDGIKISEGTISLDMIKDEKVKKSMLGKRVNDMLTVNLKKAFPNEVDLGTLLKIDKEKIADLSGEFNLHVKDISKFEKAIINQELFDKIYGKNVVKSEEEFKKKLDEEIRMKLDRDSEYKLRLDIRNSYLNKFKKDLPREFLKRWLILANKDKYTEEQIDKDFDHFTEDLKWQLIKNKIIKDNNIKVTEQEILDYAKGYTRLQFAQYYGMTDVPEETLENYAKELLEKDGEKKQLYDRKYDDKVIEFIKNTIKINNKDVSFEKFNKLLEK
jgi:trigger factor